MGIRHVVFGCSAQALELVAKGGLAIECRFIFGQAIEPVNVEGPVLEEEGLKLHLQYWPKTQIL